MQVELSGSITGVSKSRVHANAGPLVLHEGDRMPGILDRLGDFEIDLVANQVTGQWPRAHRDPVDLGVLDPVGVLLRPSAGDPQVPDLRPRRGDRDRASAAPGDPQEGTARGLPVLVPEDGVLEQGEFSDPRRSHTACVIEFRPRGRVVDRLRSGDLHFERHVREFVAGYHDLLQIDRIAIDEAHRAVHDVEISSPILLHLVEQIAAADAEKTYVRQEVDAATPVHLQIVNAPLRYARDSFARSSASQGAEDLSPASAVLRPVRVRVVYRDLAAQYGMLHRRDHLHGDSQKRRVSPKHPTGCAQPVDVRVGELEIAHDVVAWVPSPVVPHRASDARWRGQGSVTPEDPTDLEGSGFTAVSGTPGKEV